MGDVIRQTSEKTYNSMIKHFRTGQEKGVLIHNLNDHIRKIEGKIYVIQIVLIYWG